MNPDNSTLLFWAAAAACVAIALAVILVPLLRRHGKGPQAGGRQARSRTLVWSVAAVIPVLTVGGYLLLGSPNAPRLLAEARALLGMPADGHDLDKLLRQVEEKVRANPGDGNAWAVMGRAYASLERWDEAAMAYQRASQLLPANAAVLSGHAEALAVRSGRVIKGEPMELVYRALEIDPQDPKGLELAALHAYEEGNYAQAAYYFKGLLKGLEPGSRYALDVEAVMLEARKRAHLALSGGDTAKVPDATRIRGNVEIAPALRDRATGKGVIVLTARAPGVEQPLLTMQAPAAEFPLAFELSEAMVTAQGQTLAALKEVTLSARLVPAAGAKPAAGDLEGTLEQVKIGASGVRLVIDRVRP